MTEVLTEAFRVLTANPHRDANSAEVGAVVDILVEAGDEATLEVLDEALTDSFERTTGSRLRRALRASWRWTW